MAAVIETFLVFLRLGLTSFGGPVAHLAYFREAFVVRRQWLDEARFADVNRHRFFNTNNLWLDLEALQKKMRLGKGVMPLPVSWPRGGPPLPAPFARARLSRSPRTR